jgi:hypothetical protein
MKEGRPYAANCIAKALFAPLWRSRQNTVAAQPLTVGDTLAAAPLKATNLLANAKMIRWQPLAV